MFQYKYILSLILYIIYVDNILCLNLNQNYVRKTLLENDGESIIKTPSIIAYDYTNLEIQLENDNVITNGKFEYFKSPMDQISTEYITYRDDTSTYRARNFDIDWLEMKDSIQTTKAKEVSNAISNFTLILACITSTAFMIFPGSFTDPNSSSSGSYSITNHQSKLYQQYSQYEEERDFSYSGGVVWEGFDREEQQLNPFTKKFVDLS